MQRTRARLILGLIVSLAVCFAAAIPGAVFPTGQWYAQLAKPALTPPNWVFGPVWTLLYLMMAVAAWLVWSDPSPPRARIPLIVFVVQLVLNAAWSCLFFGLHSIGLALADIVVLWATILATLISFWRLRKLAGALLIPYLLWVSFAGYLNIALWRLNP